MTHFFRYVRSNVCTRERDKAWCAWKILISSCFRNWAVLSHCSGLAPNIWVIGVYDLLSFLIKVSGSLRVARWWPLIWSPIIFGSRGNVGDCENAYEAILRIACCAPLYERVAFFSANRKIYCLVWLTTMYVFFDINWFNLL